MTKVKAIHNAMKCRQQDRYVEVCCLVLVISSREWKSKWLIQVHLEGGC